MDNEAREKLAKLLMLTRSESDGEALNAIRIANTFIDKHKLTWQQVLTTKSSSPTNPFEGAGFAMHFDGDMFTDLFADLARNFERRQTNPVRKNNIITMLNAFFINDSKLWPLAGSGQRSWLKRAHEQFKKQDDLHPNDYDTLSNIYKELLARSKSRGG